MARSGEAGGSDASVTQTKTHFKNYPIQEMAVLALISILMVGVFIFDIYTPPDDVSICFIYAVLISLSVFSFRRSPYICAAVATFLSWAGAFFQTPGDTLSVVFFTNRAIAVTAQWLVAFLIVLHKDAQQRIQQQYEGERKKAETSRRFVDVLTHEIGTSLTIIEGQAFRLKKLMPAAGPEDGHSRAEKISQSVRHIERVVRQVQVASELDRGMDELEPESVNLRNVIAEAVIQSGRESIHIDTHALPAEISGNAGMLQQVVENLLSNAIKYSPAEAAISVWGRVENDQAVVSVSDRGRGIPEGERAKLFEPYYRASNSRNVQGTGIGLYVVERYIRSHGGSIGISSELGVGTTVTFQIPIAAPLAGRTT